MNRLDEALADYDKVLAHKPDFAEARFVHSLCLLKKGEFERGWREYEWRWETAHSQQYDTRDFAQPLWLGERVLKDRTILLHGEQGLGDTIQFCRFATLASQQGARVVLEVQPALRTLIATLDSSVRVTASDEERNPQFDYHCPLMSLPLAFKTTLDSIPAAIPYLYAPEQKAKLWRDRMGAGTRPRIGLAWAGSPRKGIPAANRIDRQRSIAFDQLAPLFEHTACDFYSLQKGSDAVLQLRRSAHRRHVVDWTDDLADFSDTAAMIANLDLVVTVDTAVAHLAGALGKPFWMLNRFNTCWRWLLDREDSPWYPTARIFRQTRHGDWSPVIEGVGRELQHWSAARQTP